jgi:hypothetical protein
MSDLTCWNCGASLAAIPRPISRQANCLTCHAELHACRLCRHYAPRHPAQCSEDRAEPPPRKDVANFCEWFEPTSVADARALDRNAAAKANLDALFASRAAAAPSAAAAPAADADAGTDATQAPASTGAPAPTTAQAMTKEEAARAELERLFGRKP